MKAVISLEGQIRVAELPAPAVEDGCALVETEFSAISPGTEIMMNGIHRTQQVVLGYSAAGVIRAVGAGMERWSVGQRVACYGAPYAQHAEWMLMPERLMVPVPDSVTAEEASTVGLGAIAVHALRQAAPQFGETLLVIGAGILGQLIAQIAKAAGCRVLVHDLLPERCAIAERLGIRHTASDKESAEEMLMAMTDGVGADSVIVCAGGKTGDLVDQALHWLRDRGKVLIVGDIKAEFSRDLMFMKEATVLISRAGGPGRYDAVYEKGGVDYPIGYVRWTEGRNMAEYVRLIAEGAIRVKPLIGAVFPVDDCAEAFRQFERSPGTQLGALFAYPAVADVGEGDVDRGLERGLELAANEAAANVAASAEEAVER